MVQVPGQEPLLRTCEDTLARHATVAVAHVGRRRPWWQPFADAGHAGACNIYNKYNSKQPPQTNVGLVVCARHLIAHATDPALLQELFDLCVLHFPWLYRALLAFQDARSAAAAAAAPDDAPSAAAADDAGGRRDRGRGRGRGRGGGGGGSVGVGGASEHI